MVRTCFSLFCCQGYFVTEHLETKLNGIECRLGQHIFFHPLANRVWVVVRWVGGGGGNGTSFRHIIVPPLHPPWGRKDINATV